MIQLWIAGLLLFAQPVDLPDSLTLTQQGETITIMNRENFTMPLLATPFVDIEKYERFVDKLDQQIYQAPINATINDQGVIIAGKVGYKLNQQAFKEQFYDYFYGGGPSEVEVPRIAIYPKVDSELLAHIRTQQIGQYVTYFNSYNRSRSHNIKLAAKAIDNHVIFPDETFSFNQVVGQRTWKKGYRRAPIIVRGEVAEGVGGGICQVSSTLFNAVDRAGLRIVERYSHSRYVPYVPSGRDATVSWYGPDFRFHNQYNQPILIRAKVYGGSLVVMLYSSDVIDTEPRTIPNTPFQLPLISYSTFDCYLRKWPSHSA